MAKSSVNIFWFRRDLRLHDNAGLWHALKSDRPVLPIFIFDRNILDLLEEKEDRRLVFIRQALDQLQSDLTEMGSSLVCFYGFPDDCFRDLMDKYDIGEIYCNRDYEPYAIVRDEKLKRLAAAKGIRFRDSKDQVIFDRAEVAKDNGDPYTIFTPYSRRWKSLVSDAELKSFSTKAFFSNFHRHTVHSIPSLRSMGFVSVDFDFPAAKPETSMIKQYAEHRDFPAEAGTTRMGVHLRFGTVSIRELCRKATELSETFLNELIWREFFMQILWHFPKVGKGQSFRPDYDLIAWRNDENDFERWCSGTTGYPMVDAGMRELNATGFMHNRVRMITASFLAKHLLVDWRWGEAYFAAKLLDFDLAANNGNWQWAAGCGCDAAPYFRIFNPSLQTKRFDPQQQYIRKWIPELDEASYPRPIVDHAIARKRALEVYGKALRTK